MHQAQHWHHFADVAARAERVARAGDHHAADVGTSFQLRQQRTQRRCEDVAERVFSVRLVKRDNGDAPADFAMQFVRTGIDLDHPEIPGRQIPGLRVSIR